MSVTHAHKSASTIDGHGRRNPLSAFRCGEVDPVCRSVLAGVLAAVTLLGLSSCSATTSGRPSVSRAPASPLTKTVTASPSTPPALDFATLYSREQSGVVRIETLSCSDAGIGTGFLLTPTLIATVNHVIDQAVVVSLIAGSQRTTGTVIGSDPAHDLALVRAAHPLTGYHFHFATTPPGVGDQVATIGFPIGDPITLTHGDVSGLDRNITVNGLPDRLIGLIETDTAINPGNSGGPLLNQHGDVVGLIDAQNITANAIGYAIPAGQASVADTAWEQTPSPVPPARCDNPLGPAQAQPNIPAPAPGQLTDSQATGIIAAFNTYFGGINSGNYADAYAVLSPRQHANTSEQSFADGDATSFDTGQTILDARAVTATKVVVDLAFTSLQTSDKGPNGDVCDNWTLAYTMIQAPDGSWQIDGTQPYNGSEHTRC